MRETAPRLSLCLVVRDEEELLPVCLAAAAPAADELVVVDTGSADATVAIAAAFGARVLHHPWDESFAAARNAALDAATGTWILFLDADEELCCDPAAVRAALAAAGAAEALAVPMTNLTGDGSTSSSAAILRLWRNRPDYRYRGRVHERLVGLPEGAVAAADLPVLHRGYLDARWEARGKARRNLGLLAREPAGPFTSFNLGSEHARGGEWAAAAEHFDEAWELVGDGWAAEPYGLLLAGRAARARRECGRIMAAEALLEQALAACPAYTDLLLEQALCALARDAGDEAAALLRRCLAQGDAPAHLLGTDGAGSHLASALLERITRPG